jgi:hypothetical protein
MLSDCLEHTGDLGRATEAARRGAEGAPDRPRYLERYAELLLRQGHAAQAQSLERRIRSLRAYRQRVDGPASR